MRVEKDVLVDVLESLEEDLDEINEMEDEVPGDAAIMREHIQTLYMAIEELLCYRDAYPDARFEPVFFTDFGPQRLQ